MQYPTGGGSAAWTADGAGIFYTRYPHQGERPEADVDFYQQVWFHRLGTPVAEDQYAIGKDFPRIAEIALEASEDGQWVLAAVANGDGGDFAHYLRDAAGEWQQLTRFEDGIKQVKFGRDGALYLLSRKDAPRGKVLRLPLDDARPGEGHAWPCRRAGAWWRSLRRATTACMSPTSWAARPSCSITRAAAPGRAQIPILPVSSVSGLDSWHGDELVFGNVSYVKPFAWFTYDPAANAVRRTALYLTSPADFDDIEVVREFATSKDGTKVPLNILRKKGLKRDGRNPTLLYGYGGYGVNLTPGFDSTRRIWFDAGGVYVVANLRGGGEYGEQWHKAGNLTHKQHVFDDFIAAAEHLIERRYTNPSKLAVEGGSNGGLLMGAFLTQRPDLARAVVAHVGIHDMLRVELDPNGQFNVTEFGTVKDPEQFKALFAYSPFHHVRDGVKYPAVLLTTGENDGRVNPAQSRKMAARLQAATGFRPADPLPQHRQRRPRHRQLAEGPDCRASRRAGLPLRPTRGGRLAGGRFSDVRRTIGRDAFNQRHLAVGTVTISRGGRSRVVARAGGGCSPGWPSDITATGTTEAGRDNNSLTRLIRGSPGWIPTQQAPRPCACAASSRFSMAAEQSCSR